MGQDLACIVREFAEQIVLSRCQVNLISACTYSAMGIVDYQTIFSTTTIERLLCVSPRGTAAQTRRFLRSAQCYTQASQQFIEAKRFGQVVIGSQVQRLNLYWLFVVRG